MVVVHRAKHRSDSTLSHFNGERLRVVRPAGGPLVGRTCLRVKPRTAHLLVRSGMAGGGWRVWDGDGDPLEWDVPAEREVDVAELVAGSAAEAIAAVGSLSLADLRDMLEAERVGKARVTVVAAIEAAIEE